MICMIGCCHHTEVCPSVTKCILVRDRPELVFINSTETEMGPKVIIM